MRVAIMQPTYLPWCGYFDLIASVDRFVFLDTVPLARQRNNWQTANRIRTAEGLRWLRLPAQRPDGEGLIKDVTFEQGDAWAEGHKRLIAEAYGAAPHYDGAVTPILGMLGQEWGALADLNIALIEEFARYLGLSTQLLRASEIAGAEGAKAERLISICEVLGADAYHSPVGSFDYIDPVLFAGAGLKLTFQHFEHPVYDQGQGDFVSHLSVIDMLAHCGPDSAALTAGGHCPSWSYEDLARQGLGEEAACAG